MWQERGGIALVIGASLCFGAIVVVARIGYGYGAEPLSMLFIRNLLVAAVLGVMLLATGRELLHLTRSQHVSLLGLGLMVGTFTYLYMASVQFIPASLAVMLFYTYPALVAVLALFLLGEPLTRQRSAALLLAALGVAAMVGVSLGGATAVGMVYALGGALVMAGIFVVAAQIGRGVSAMVTTTYTNAVSGIGFGVAALFAEGTSWTLTPPIWAVIGISALLTAGGCILIFRGIALVGPARAAIACYVEPAVTIGLSVILLQEGLTWLQGFGAGLIIAAIRLVQTQPERKPDVPREPEPPEDQSYVDPSHGPGPRASSNDAPAGTMLKARVPKPGAEFNDARNLRGERFP